MSQKDMSDDVYFSPGDTVILESVHHHMNAELKGMHGKHAIVKDIAKGRRQALLDFSAHAGGAQWWVKFQYIGMALQ